VEEPAAGGGIDGAEDFLETDGGETDCCAKPEDNEAEGDLLSPGLPDGLVLEAAEGGEEEVWSPEGDDEREVSPEMRAVVSVGGGFWGDAWLGGDLGVYEGDGCDAAFWPGEGLGSADGGRGGVGGVAGGGDGDISEVVIGLETKGHGSERRQGETTRFTGAGTGGEGTGKKDGQGTCPHQLQ